MAIVFTLTCFGMTTLLCLHGVILHCWAFVFCFLQQESLDMSASSSLADRRNSPVIYDLAVVSLPSLLGLCGICPSFAALLRNQSG